jgi:hypothetical protein
MNDKNLLMAYLAGVMDGDGSFSLLRLKKGSKNYLYAPMLQCASWRLEFIFLLKEAFGGNLVTGKIHINKNGQEGHALTCWKLRSRSNCIPVLKELIPFLTIKKHRAGILLAFCEYAHFTRGKLLSEEQQAVRENLYYFMTSRNKPEHAETKVESVKIDCTYQEAWAYIAGIWDTDGSFSIKKQCINKGTNVKNPRYLPVISLSMMDARAINFIRSAFAPFGESKLYVPKNKAMTNKYHFQFGIYTKSDCINFLKRIIPYLKSKKENALTLLEFCEKSQNTGYCKAGIPESELKFREECHQKLCHLNKYGVFKPSLIDLEARRGDRAEAKAP